MRGNNNRPIRRQNSTLSIPISANQMEPQVPELGPHDDAPPTYEWALQYSPAPGGATFTNIPIITLIKVIESRVRSSVQDCRFDPSAPYMYIRTAHAQNPILKYSLDGELVRSFGSSNKREGSVCVDTSRDLLLSTSGNSVYRTTRLGVPPGVLYHSYIRVSQARNINHVTYIESRDVYAVTDLDLNALLLVHPSSGDVKKMVGGKGSGDRNFNRPHSVAYNATSPHDVIAVTDYYNHCVKVYSVKGKPREVLGCHGHGEGQLVNPAGVCIDSRGRILVADTGNRRVMRADPGHAGGTAGRRGVRWDCILTPEQLDGRFPRYIDVSPNGHVIVSTMTSLLRDAKHYWTLFKNYS